MTTLINEKRFFEQVAPFLFNKGDMLPEMIENAIRAKATTVTIKTEKETLLIENNGNVLEDFTNLFIVAQSNYENDIEKAQKPAGMGILSLISNSIEVTFESGNKSIKIDSKRYFNDVEYRATLVNSIQESENYINGMRITVILEKAIDSNITHKLNQEFTYYNIDITFNETIIKTKTQIEALFQKEISKGVIALVPKHSLSGHWSENTAGYVIWHGKLINAPQIKPFSIIVNGETELITPTLPDRKGITLDNISGKELSIKLERLMRNEIQEFINEEEQFSIIQKTLSHLNETYNLDSLNNYYHCTRSKEDEKYFDNSKEVEIYINNELEEDLYLSIVEECANSKGFKFINLKLANSIAPQWVLNRVQNKCVFEIEKSDKSNYANGFNIYRENFEIVDSIKLNNVDILALNSSDDVIYFTKDFNFYSFSSNNRDRYNYDEESLNETEREINEDFESIIAVYNDKITIDMNFKLNHAIRNLIDTKQINKDDISKIEITKDENENWKLSIQVNNENLNMAYDVVNLIS